VLHILASGDRRGGYAHILKGYFYTNLVGTLESPLWTRLKSPPRERSDFIGYSRDKRPDFV
jgi:hypothetical protein